MLSRSWISTTLSLTLAVALGCGKPEDKLVWVDVHKAARSLAVVTPAGEASVSLTGSVQGAKVFLSALQPSDRGREAATRRRADAVALMASQVEAAQVRLENIYRTQLEAIARSTAADKRTEFATNLLENAESTRKGVEAIMLTHADERGDVLGRLALLAKWPLRPLHEPQLLNFFPIADRSAVEGQWQQEMDRLTARLDVIDQEIEAQIGPLLAEYDKYGRDKAAQIDLVEGQELTSAIAEASRRANERIGATSRGDLPELLDVRAGALPGQPAVRANIPVASFRAEPIPKPAALPPPMNAVLSRLNIWLRIQGYKLARGPREAPDKTGDFIAWINHQ
ncbi:MAG: hypothetical protein ACR2HJ_10110 [Fimbriimonadales bacterium]